MNIDPQTFNRGAVRPFVCLREGWQLIKDDYWLFFGITFIGALIGGMASVFLVGPMTCGIFLCLLRRERDQLVSFDMVFKGFDYFVPSLIATLIMAVPMIVLMLGMYAMLIGGVFGILALFQPQRGVPADPNMIWSFLGVGAVTVIGFVAVANFVQALFLFVYPLIVERKATGFEAVMLSVRAAFSNLFGVLGLMTLIFLIMMVGLLCCYIGAILALPLSYAMMTVAYRQVFPAVGMDPDVAIMVEPDDDPAPPILEVIETGFQEEPPTAVKPSEPIVK